MMVEGMLDWFNTAYEGKPPENYLALELQAKASDGVVYEFVMKPKTKNSPAQQNAVLKERIRVLESRIVELGGSVP